MAAQPFGWEPSSPAQVDGSSQCCLCKGSLLGSNPCKASDDGQQVDILFTGSPCPPFSTQRVKRFQPGAVVEHSLYRVTDTAVQRLILQEEPKKMVLEQVWGFCLPYDTTTSETPKDRCPMIPFWCLLFFCNFSFNMLDAFEWMWSPVQHLLLLCLHSGGI